VRRPRSLDQQAPTPCRVVRFHPDAIVEMTRRDIEVANLIAEKTWRRVFDYIDVAAGISFGSMRQRLIRHLLDLAASDQRGATPMVARRSQQALADAVGCVRDVVVRLLRELREEGLIRTGRNEIELLQPDRLHPETFLARVDRNMCSSSAELQSQTRSSDGTRIAPSRRCSWTRL
jgi:CRP/FNR family cyclic AMP-dependent transcriptional regulator